MAAALNSLIPQFAFISGMINNDGSSDTSKIAQICQIRTKRESTKVHCVIVDSAFHLFYRNFILPNIKRPTQRLPTFEIGYVKNDEPIHKIIERLSSLTISIHWHFDWYHSWCLLRRRQWGSVSSLILAAQRYKFA
jgi:hypothetical protein